MFLSFGFFNFSFFHTPTPAVHHRCGDRIGKKPLYYALEQNRIVFASELKALLTVSGISREIDHRFFRKAIFLFIILDKRKIFD
ncbi:MAG: hypothetical protein K9J81_00875 [Desulfohalobiaceae bacterium]|nr:hypothetical protein [Desulfohalobiaceae bacterium]